MITEAKSFAVRTVARLIAQANGLTDIQTAALVRLTATRCQLMSPARACSIARHDARSLRSGDFIPLSHALLRGDPGDTIDKIILVGVGASIPLVITNIYLMVAPI